MRFIDDILQDLPFFAHHHDADLHILMMDTVNHHAIDHRKNNRIYQDFRRAGEERVSVNYQTDEQAHFSDREIRFFERDPDPQDIDPTGRTTRAQAQPNAKAADDPTDDRNGQQVVQTRQKRLDRHEGHRDRDRDDGDHRFQEEFAVDRAERDQQKRDIEKHQDHTSQILKIWDDLLQQLNDDPGDTGHIADVKTRRQDQQVQGDRIDDAAQDTEKIIEHIFPKGLFQRARSSSVFDDFALLVA